MRQVVAALLVSIFKQISDNKATQDLLEFQQPIYYHVSMNTNSGSSSGGTINSASDGKKMFNLLSNCPHINTEQKSSQYHQEARTWNGHSLNPQRV